MTVLVTGASGLVGRHLVERLRSDGVRVRAFVRSSSDSAHLRDSGIDLVEGDLAIGAPLDAAADGCDIVYHLAAAHGPGADEARCRAVNVDGTERLARAAARAGVRRFVLTSSRGVHGLVTGGVVNELTPVAPDTPYRRSKLEGERVVARCASEHGLEAVTLRLPSILGPGSRTWLPLFAAVARGGFRMIGSGAHRFHPADARDVADALVLAGTTPAIDGETFVIGGAAPVSLREFIEQIAEVLGVRLSRAHVPLAPYRLLLAARAAAARLRGAPSDTDHRQFWTSSYEIDDRKARRRLGYAPRRSMKDGVAATAAWYRERGLL